MVFKQFDRYVGWSFLMRFIIGVLVVASLYFSFDVLKRMDEFQSSPGESTFLVVFKYYAYLLPVFLVEITPGIVLVAAGMVLVRMAAQRELLVLKAIGVSAYRVTMPIFAWALIIAMLLFVVRERVVPRFTRNYTVLDNVLDQKVASHVWVKDRAHGREIRIGRYSFEDGRMTNVSVFELYPDAQPGTGRPLKRLLHAAEAALEGGQLVLTKVTTHRLYARRGNVLVPPEGENHGTLRLPTGITPFDIGKAAREGNELSVQTRTLGELRRSMKRYPEVPDYGVTFHWKLASFFNPIILLLIGIPALIGGEQRVRSRFLAAVVCIVLAGLFYALIFVFSSIGKAGTLHPALAGWMPCILGGAVGLYLFESRLS